LQCNQGQLIDIAARRAREQQELCNIPVPLCIKRPVTRKSGGTTKEPSHWSRRKKRENRRRQGAHVLREGYDGLRAIKIVGWRHGRCSKRAGELSGSDMPHVKDRGLTHQGVLLLPHWLPHQDGSRQKAYLYIYFLFLLKALHSDPLVSSVHPRLRVAFCF
jgi:hypothetical protein